MSLETSSSGYIHPSLWVSSLWVIYIIYTNGDAVFPQPGNTKGGNSDDEHPGESITACILIGFLIIVSPNDFSDTDTMGM